MKLLHGGSEPARESSPGTERGADVELMRLVAAGDARAEHLVATRLAARGLRIARALVSHHEDAKDVVQDGLLEIFRAASSYRGEATIERWAERVFVRRSMRYVRRVRDVRARREVLVDTADLDRATDAVPVALLAQMNEHVARLSPEHQRVLLLRFALGYTVPEAAELTATSPNTIKKRLLRALEKLRDLVEREERSMKVRR